MIQLAAESLVYYDKLQDNDDLSAITGGLRQYIQLDISLRQILYESG